MSDLNLPTLDIEDIDVEEIEQSKMDLIEDESGGAIRGRASVKYNWGGHRTMDIAGSMPIVRYNDTDGNFGEITISRR